MNALSTEIRNSFPKLIANGAIALTFLITSYIILWTLNGIKIEIVFLLRIGFLLAAGIFLVRVLFNALTILDKVTGLFVKLFGINDGLTRQRIFKDTIFIITILLITAALFPIISQLQNSITFLQQITTYVALGLILLFMFDIGRTFYRITEKKVNEVTNRISNSINQDEKINGK